MKYSITYTRQQKKILEYAIKMATAWYEGHIEPVYYLMINAYKDHHPSAIDKYKEAFRQIRQDIERIREIDTSREAFGRPDLLMTMKLPKKGEYVISEEEALAIEYLTNVVSNLIGGAVEVCFNFRSLSVEDPNIQQELKILTDRLHTLCWNMPVDQSYGVCYSENSDILWDMCQVLRYERYLNLSQEEQDIMSSKVFVDIPIRYSREPLMIILTIQDPSIGSE